MRSLLLDEGTILAWVCQLVGYAALLAVYPHSDPTPVAELFHRLPTAVLVPIAVLAIPAVAIAIAVGAVFAAVGVSPMSLPAILMAPGDLLVIVIAYGIGLAAMWAYGRGVKGDRTG